MAQRKKESIYNEQPRVVVPYSKMGIKILSEQQIQNMRHYWIVYKHIEIDYSLLSENYYIKTFNII